MVEWDAPHLQARLAILNMNIIFLLLGLYGWEYLQSLEVEYAVIRGRLSFRWPLVPYLLGRLFLFVFLLLLVIRTSPPSKSFVCLPSAISAAVSGNIALAASSANLMIRTWVIWKDSRLVHILLLGFAIGHWTVLILDVVNLRNIGSNGTCNVQVVHPKINAAVFVYSLAYDFLVLVLSVVGLSKERSKSPLMKRLRAQGFIYFVVTVIMYIPPTAFSFLGGHLITGLTGIPAITASTIASCRAVRSLLGLRTSDSSGMAEEEEGLRTEVALTSQIPVQTVQSGAV